MARKFALVERESEEESSSEEEEEEEEDVEEAHVARKGPVPRGQQNVVPSTAGTSQDQQEERGVPVPSRIKIKMKGGPAGSAPGCKVSDLLRGSNKRWEAAGWPPCALSSTLLPSVSMPHHRPPYPLTPHTRLHPRCAAERTTRPVSSGLPTLTAICVYATPWPPPLPILGVRRNRPQGRVRRGYLL